MESSRNYQTSDSLNFLNNTINTASASPMLSLRYHPFENICGFTNPYYGENNGLTELELQKHSNHMRSVTDAMHYFFKLHPSIITNSPSSPRSPVIESQSPLVSPAVSSKKNRKEVEKLDVDHPNLCTTQCRVIHPNLVHSVNQRWQLRVHLLNQNSGVLKAADLSHPYVNEIINANAPVTPRMTSRHTSRHISRKTTEN
ncbi:unnamed protein product [Cryptosporidium hominis]|uniref:Uncharacterized protein n=1 Tax=Cryptosporidium hominis TaxID=237895 RepID=A0A0S4TIR1_CRYHO|nr:hypothetical protein [Cryptosporidium hominis TU502]OLQ18925.1 hypothetical protein ChTU502y2012_415g0245 [Cryptosporidium hominis]PPA63573.1 hypothetical protein ChUKH1_08535 [Cryptosporidium hominis]PPS97883.1 Uncharacterized protein GY17_00000363 [Cryptosporidium hominis]CUV06777.1 unnamed protein product [Cryptosporidium hominis]|eukprot:PPS97883.1 Uncharacterized protein GY17_00000363 [Cryptosporidium hominis]